MAKFKVGDRVKYVSDHYDDSEDNPKWSGVCGNIAGTIEEDYGEYQVRWDNGTTNSAYEDDDLELIMPRTTLSSSTKPKFKVGDEIIGNQSTRYTITIAGWKGIVTKDEDSNGIFSAKGVNNPSAKQNGKFEMLYSQHFDLIKPPKKTKPMKALEAATKALKRSAPQKEYAVDLIIKIKVNAADEDDAKEMALEAFENTNMVIIKSHIPTINKVNEIIPV